MKGTQSKDKNQSEKTKGAYEIKLEEIRGRVERNAETDVLELYTILTKDEDRKPKEAKKLLEHDLGDLYAKNTILQFLPEECKDEVKSEAGKIGAEAKKNKKAAEAMTVLTDGSISASAGKAEPSSVSQKEPKSGSSTSENVDIEELQNRIANLTNDNKKANEAVVRLKSQLEQVQKADVAVVHPPQLQIPPNKVLLTVPPAGCRWVLTRIPQFDEKTLQKAKPLIELRNEPDLQETTVDDEGDLETCYNAFTAENRFVTALKIYHTRGTTRFVRALVLPIERREAYYKD